MLNKYLAKSDSTTIQQHNDELRDILKQIIDIYDIENIEGSIERCIEYHDIGKCSETMQKIFKFLL